MKADEGAITRLIKVYPKSYRTERGAEIVATLLESSSRSRGRLGALDVLDVLVHGMEVRLGLTSERFAGRIVGAAAIPGLIVAAGLSAFLLVTAIWPPHQDVPLALRSGPFATCGPVVYAVWIGGLAGSLLWPVRRRPIASICVLSTLVAIPIGILFFASTNWVMMCVLASFGLPGALAPSASRSSQLSLSQISSGVALFVGIWWLGGVIGRPGQGFIDPSAQWVSVPRLGTSLSWIIGISFLATCVLLILRRTTAAGALVVLTAPWLFVAAAYRRNENGSIGLDVVLLGIMFVWLFATWLADFRQPEKSVLRLG